MFWLRMAVCKEFSVQDLLSHEARQVMFGIAKVVIWSSILKPRDTYETRIFLYQKKKKKE